MGTCLAKNCQKACATYTDYAPTEAQCASIPATQAQCAALLTYTPTAAQCATVAPTQTQCAAAGFGYTLGGANDWTAAQCLTKYGDDSTLFNATTCSASCPSCATPVYDQSTCSTAIQTALAAVPPCAVCQTCAAPVYNATTCAGAIQAYVGALPAAADWTQDQCRARYLPDTPWKCVGLNGTVTDTPVRRFNGAIQCLGTDGMGCKWSPPAECARNASTVPLGMRPSGNFTPYGPEGWPTIAHTRL